MSRKILLVDGDVEVLKVYREGLASNFEIDTATSGDQGLAMVREQGPYAVVVSDMQTESMNGIDFLAHVREIAPHVVRIILTGYSSAVEAIAAVNQGKIYRFLTKPCEVPLLAEALEEALVQFGLNAAEHDLLENTLSSAVEALVEVLGLVNPAAFSRTRRIRRCVSRLIAKRKMKEAWRFEVAAMLSQLGCVTLHPEVLDFVTTGHPLSPSDQAAFDAHPRVTQTLLSKIPRLEAVAWIVAQQQGLRRDVPEVVDGMSRETIAYGAEILRLAIAHETMIARGLTHDAAVSNLRHSPEHFHPELLDTLAGLRLGSAGMEIRSCAIRELVHGMIINEEVRTTTGLLVVAKGQEVSYALLERLKNFRERNAIRDPVLVIARTD